ncbi:MAG: hypothetical protein QN120_01405 [Armatimonadota bacterium]|nr:hypothetical protein [Armatimonadota bacterium]
MGPVVQLGLVSSDASTYRAARAAGARVVKVLADWNVLEPQRGRLSWTDQDRLVAAAIGEGLAVVMVLAHTPRWASVGTGADLNRVDIYSRQPPRDVRDWERFVGAVAERYRGRVADYQVWTRLGLPDFRGTGTEYLALLQAARTRVRAADPAARIVMATPVGVDLGFILGVAERAPAAFDAASLVPEGFAPERLLRPLSVLSQRLRPLGKAVWMDWLPEEAASQAASADLWARLLAVAAAGGVQRVFAAAPAQIGVGLHQAASVLLAEPLLGYLQREPDVYAVVLGSGAAASAVVWATAEGRTLELPAVPARATTIDGRPVIPEAREGRAVLRLGLEPLVVHGIPVALIEEARATAARSPMLPVVAADRDYGRRTEVYARLGRQGEERGLYNLPYRSRRGGAVEPVEVGGAEAVKTSIARQVVYVYFDVDDTFLYFEEGRTPIEVSVEVWGARATRQVGFNLLYDSIGGYRFTPWQWVDVRDGWTIHTVRLTDARMANTWGWDFAINAAGNRTEDLIVRTVTVRKGAP